MKILVLLSRVPYPLDKGDKLRAYHQLSELSRTFDISLFCLNEGKIHPEAVKELKKLCHRVEVVQFSRWARLWNLVRAFFNPLPFQVNYFYSKSTQKKFDRFLESDVPDVLYCQLIRTAEYIKKYHSLPKVLDYMDAFSSSYERRLNSSSGIKKIAITKETDRLRAYESEIFKAFSAATIISAQDKQHLPVQPKENLHVIPNGVDTDFFQPKGIAKTHDLVFVGNMNYPPNVDATEVLVNKILPLVSKKLGRNATCLISGTSPHQRVKSLASPTVTITGFVDDIRASYESASVFAAPLRQGAGLQNKLLEAMAMKTPCVSSPLANNALQAIHEKEILVGDSHSEFANHIVTLLKEKEQAIQMAERAREFVENKYSWRSHTDSLRAILTSVFT